jgi:L-fuculose-phosphate aldolase
MEYAQERSAVASFMRRLYRQKLTTTSGGNISLRIDAEKVAITPAQLDKGRMRAEQVAIVTMDGRNLTPEFRMSSETPMHLAILQACPQVQAVVHAHPVTASAFSTAATPISCELLSETYAILGKIVIAPYALTGTLELAENVAAAARQANCILMKNHGVVALGRTLLEAFDRLEVIETAAQSTLIVRQLDGVRTISAEERQAIDNLMGRA